MPNVSAFQTATPDDEQALVRRIVAGDRDAFELLMRRHNRRLYRLARATLRNDAEAEDALQDAYLSAYRSIGRFRGDAALSTWLCRLVLNECMGRLRKQARRDNLLPMQHDDTELDTMASPDTDTPEQTLARAEIRVLLEHRLDKLPEIFRTVFVLRCVEEMSVEETAHCLGITEATVRSRHFRARSLLRQSFTREFDAAQRELYQFGGEHCDRVVARVMARLQDLPQSL